MLEPQLYMDRARADLRFTSHFGPEIVRGCSDACVLCNVLRSQRPFGQQGHCAQQTLGVHSAFGEEFVKTGLIEVEYAKMLANAFDSRIDSDYDVLFAPEQALAEEVLKDARRFVGRAEQYLRQAGFLG